MVTLVPTHVFTFLVDVAAAPFLGIFSCVKAGVEFTTACSRGSKWATLMAHFAYMIATITISILAVPVWPFFNLIHGISAKGAGKRMDDSDIKQLSITFPEQLLNDIQVVNGRDVLLYRVLCSPEWSGFAISDTIYVPEVPTGSRSRLRLFRHELIHTCQFRYYGWPFPKWAGIYLFLARYGAAIVVLLCWTKSLDDSYIHHPAEVQAYTYETAKRAAELTHEGHLGWYRQFSCFDQHWSFDWSFHRALDN